MEQKKMCIGLFTGSIDKMTAAGVILSGAVADDYKVDVYVLLQAARAFKKEIGDDASKLNMAENQELKAEFENSLKQLKVNTWLKFFDEAKMLSDVKIHICGLAGNIWGADKMEDFVYIVDDIVGINSYITSAHNSDIHLFI